MNRHVAPSDARLPKIHTVQEFQCPRCKDWYGSPDDFYWWGGPPLPEHPHYKPLSYYPTGWLCEVCHPHGDPRATGCTNLYGFVCGKVEAEEDFVDETEEDFVEAMNRGDPIND